MKNIISNLISTKALVADHPISIEDRQILLTPDEKVYVCNTKTKRCYVYNADGSDCKQITVKQFNVQASAYKARVKASEAKAEREKIATWKAEHGESKAQDGRSAETNATIPDAVPDMNEVPVRREERWVSSPEKSYIWPLGSFIKVRLVEKPDSRSAEGRIIADSYLEEGAYRFQLEEVRAINGVAVPTGKTYWFSLQADQKTVDSFKKAVNKRYDNFIWKKLNEGVEHKWDCKKVTTVELGTFFEYLAKFPIKVLYDYTEWVDKDTNEVRRSKKPKVRLWLPGDFDSDNGREYHNPKATR